MRQVSKMAGLEISIILQLMILFFSPHQPMTLVEEKERKSGSC